MRMQIPKSLILGLIIGLNGLNYAEAGELEDKIAEAAGKEYAKQQLTKNLATFIDKNPKILFSTDPQIGSKSVKFIAKAVAIHGLITAKTDRERAWSAAHLILSPEPTTAAVLFAVQLADTYLSLRAQEQLAQIYKQIAEVQAETVKILTQIHINEFQTQQRILQEFDESTERIKSLYGQLKSHPALVYLSEESFVSKVPSEAEVEDAIRLFIDLKVSLDQLERSALWVEALVRPQIFGMSEDYIETCKNYNRSFDPIRQQLTEVHSSFNYFYSSLNAEKLKRQIKMDLEPYTTQVRIYKSCVSLINTMATASFWQEIKPDFDQNEFIQDCQIRYGI